MKTSAIKRTELTLSQFAGDEDMARNVFDILFASVDPNKSIKEFPQSILESMSAARFRDVTVASLRL